MIFNIAKVVLQHVEIEDTTPNTFLFFSEIRYEI